MYIIVMRGIALFLSAVELLVLGRCVLSFVARDTQSNVVVKTIYEITEPLLKPIRDLIYKLNVNTGMLDFSPIILFLIIRVIRSLIF